MSSAHLIPEEEIRNTDPNEIGYARLANAASEANHLSAKLADIVRAAEESGWNGVTNSKLLTTYIIELGEEHRKATRKAKALRRELAELRGIIYSPLTANFLDGVRREAAHQVARWRAAHDAGKGPEDWFWLIGYLGGKALRAAMLGDTEKALHHTISTAAALFNWHRQLSGVSNSMRPGIEPPKEGSESDG